jgi:hypothetical protein
MNTDPNLARNLILTYAAIPLTVVVILFVIMPSPFQGHGSAQVLAVDATVLLVGAIGLIVLPPLLARSGWLVLSALGTVPVYLFVVFVSWWFVPYGWAWVRCMHQPVITDNFMAADDYSVPGDLSYTPGILSDYVCTVQEAEAGGYRRTPFAGPTPER